MKKNEYSTPDYYADKAKKEGYAARSVYKLEEIDQKYQIFKGKKRILDLGACPGSWSQYALKKTGKQAQVWGIDLKPVSSIQNDRYHFIQGDINDHLEQFKLLKFDLVLSDMAPNTSGVKAQDAFLSHDLSFMALDIAVQTLNDTGIFICKIFQGDGIDDFYIDIKKYFKRFKSLKPKAVRKNSKEIYVIAWDLKNKN